MWDHCFPSRKALAVLVEFLLVHSQCAHSNSFSKVHSRPPYLCKRIKPLLLLYYYFRLSFQVLLTNDYKEKIKKTLPGMNSPPELLYQDYNVVMAKTTKTAYKCMTREYKSDRDKCPTTASSSSLACTLVFVM